MKYARLGVLAAVVPALAGALYLGYAPFRYWTWAVSGRSPVCPASQAVQSEAHIRSVMAAKDRILKASHLVREDQGLELWQTPEGEFWIPRGNRYVLPFNLAEMEHHIYGSGANFIRPGDIVLDCGASDGDFTRVALKAGAKLVVSVEVSPQNAECLRRNLGSDIAAGRVIVYPKGVWDKDDTLLLNVSDSNFAANSVVLRPDGSRGDVRVPLTTIDQLVAELKLPRVDFIKMDVEGAEVKALAGGRETISRYRPRLAIATEHKPDDERTIPAAVRAAHPDYRMACGPCSESGGRIHPDVLYFF